MNLKLIDLIEKFEDIFVPSEEQLGKKEEQDEIVRQITDGEYDEQIKKVAQKVQRMFPDRRNKKWNLDATRRLHNTAYDLLDLVFDDILDWQMNMSVFDYVMKSCWEFYDELDAKTN